MIFHKDYTAQFLVLHAINVHFHRISFLCVSNGYIEVSYWDVFKGPLQFGIVIKVYCSIIGSEI